MSAEIVFILEPDTGRVTIESSQASANVVNEIKRDLGPGTTLNCARPQPSVKSHIIGTPPKKITKAEAKEGEEFVYLFRIYHYSTVDGPGRRSVVQLAGCSIRCPGCYVPETHDRVNGKPALIEKIVAEIDKKSGEHDGVTIFGGEPFDQTENLEKLVQRLKERNYHLTVYSGYTIENLLGRESESIKRILSNTDLLIDGAFDRELATNAGEYRGSSNQRLILETSQKT